MGLVDFEDKWLRATKMQGANHIVNEDKVSYNVWNNDEKMVECVNKQCMQG